MGRKSDPLKVLFSIAGATLKAAAAIEKASQKAVAQAESERLRALKAAQRSDRELERELQRKYKERLRQEKQEEATRLRDEKESTKRQEALRKENEKRRVLAEKEMAKEEKQREVERKKYLKEIKEELTLETIAEFGLNEKKNYIYDKNFDYTLGLDIVEFKKSNRSDLFEISKYSMDDFIWSGAFNSVIGVKGLIKLKTIMEGFNLEWSEADWLSSETCLEVLSQTGCYFDKDIDRFPGDFSWLTAFRKLTVGQADFIGFLDYNTSVELLDGYKIPDKDLRMLKEYLEEFKINFFREFLMFHLNKSKLKLLA